MIHRYTYIYIDRYKHIYVYTHTHPVWANCAFPLACKPKANRPVLIFGFDKFRFLVMAPFSGPKKVISPLYFPVLLTHSLEALVLSGAWQPFEKDSGKWTRKVLGGLFPKQFTVRGSKFI